MLTQICTLEGSCSRDQTCMTREGEGHGQYVRSQKCFLAMETTDKPLVFEGHCLREGSCWLLGGKL